MTETTIRILKFQIQNMRAIPLMTALFLFTILYASFCSASDTTPVTNITEQLEMISATAASTKKPDQHKRGANAGEIVNPAEAAIADLLFMPAVIPIGGSTQLIFDTKNFMGGERATITIYKYPDGDTSRKFLADTLSATLPSGMGQIKLAWTPPADCNSCDTAAKKEGVIKGPDEYRFEVKIASAVSSHPSKALWLSKDLEYVLQTEDGTPAPDGTEVRITMANGVSRYAKSQGGIVLFTNVLVGTIRQEIVRGEIVRVEHYINKDK